MQKSTIYSIIVILILSLGEFGDILPILKYGKYLTFLIFIFILFESKFKLRKDNLKIESPLFPFILIIIVNILYVIKINRFLIIETIILSGAVLPFIVAREFKLKLKLINISLLILFFLKIGLNFTLNFSFDAFLLSETSSAETNIFPFLFGMFAIYFLTLKNYRWFMINAIGVILGFKRITFIGLFLIFVFQIFRFHKLKGIIVLGIIANFIWLYFSYFITTDSFIDISYNISNLPPAHLTMGRSSFYGAIWDEFMNGNQFLNFFVGLGGGQSRIIMQDFYNNEAHLLHNDILKIFIEYGVVIFSIFIISLYHKKKKIILLTMFLNLTFLTDNTLIYEPVLFLFFILTQEIYNKNTNEKNFSKLHN